MREEEKEGERGREMFKTRVASNQTRSRIFSK